MVDVGGGFHRGGAGEWDGIGADVQAARSVDVGCVRITERHLRADSPSDRDVGSAEAFATQALAGAFAEVPVDKARTWVGVAGTVTTLSAIARSCPSTTQRAPTSPASRWTSSAPPPRLCWRPPMTSAPGTRRSTPAGWT